MTDRPNPHWNGKPPKKKGVAREEPPIGKSTWHGNPIWYGGIYVVKDQDKIRAVRDAN